MNMRIVRNTIIFILIIIFSPYLCIARPPQEAEKAKYFDDSGEFLFPQVEKPLYDADSQASINSWTYKNNGRRPLVHLRFIHSLDSGES